MIAFLRNFLAFFRHFDDVSAALESDTHSLAREIKVLKHSHL